MTRRTALRALLVSALAFAVAVARGQQPEPKKLTAMRSLNVRDTLYILTGGGGNSLALVDEENGGIVLVDTKLPGWGRPILDALRAITDLPVTTIINTHAHDDHTGGNNEFPSAAQIIAHENTKANMAKMDAFKGANARFLPNKTFRDRMSLLDGVNRIELYYFGAGHTNGDTIVVFPEKGVVYMGDLFPTKAAPLIDTANGGSGVAYPETLAKAVAEIKGVDRVITGQVVPGPDTPERGGLGGRPMREVLKWSDLQEYAGFNRDFLAAVKGAMSAGQNVDNVAAGLKLPEAYKSYGLERAKANVQVIYNELKK